MPVTLATIAAVAGGVKTLGGIAQTAFSGQKKAEKNLEKSIEAIPEYTMSPSILQYYEQAKQRYGVSPTQTAMYKRQMQNIQRAGATGLAGLGGARARIGAVPSIVRTLSDASLGAEVAGEQEQARRFGQLGSATQMKAGQEAAVEQRKLAKQYQRISAAQAKAAGRAAVKRAGLTNIFGGLTDVAKAGMSKEEGA
jgi:hypothetical protein